jgi:AICAR transformylase/IMP cyclohydrolase PurH
MADSGKMIIQPGGSVNDKQEPGKGKFGNFRQHE